MDFGAVRFCDCLATLGTIVAIPLDMTASVTAAEFLAALPAAINLQSREGSPLQVPDAIRRDLKLAVKVGLIPAHAKFSVTRRDYKSITAELTAWHGQVLSTEYVESYMEHVAAKKQPHRTFVWEGSRDRRYSWESRAVDARVTSEINDVMKLVEQIADRHNYDKSDSMVDHFDTGYYLHVGCGPALETALEGLRAEVDVAFATLTAAAHAAAARLGAKIVKSICGKGGLATAGEWALGRLVDLDKNAKGRPLTFCKQRRRWIVEVRSGQDAIVIENRAEFHSIRQG